MYKCVCICVYFMHVYSCKTGSDQGKIMRGRNIGLHSQFY